MQHMVLQIARDPMKLGGDGGRSRGGGLDILGRRVLNWEVTSLQSPDDPKDHRNYQSMFHVHFFSDKRLDEIELFGYFGIALSFRNRSSMMNHITPAAANPESGHNQ